MRIESKRTRLACFAIVAFASTLAFRAVAQTAAPAATPTQVPRGKGKPVPIIVTLNYDANNEPTSIAGANPDTAKLSKKQKHFATWCLVTGSDDATMTIDFKNSPFPSKQYKTKDGCVRSEQPTGAEGTYKYSITVTVDGKTLPVLDPIIKVTP
jgi:hypothetical protein